MTSPSRYSVRLLAATFAFCVAGVQAQVQMQQKQGVAPQMQRQTAPLSASVEIVAMSATPAAPKQGEMVTIKLSMRNSGQTVVAQVPWAIHWNTANQTLAHGVEPNVVPGAVFEVTASWRAVPGQQLVAGYVDPTGKTFNNAAPVALRIRNLPLTIAQMSASTQGAAPAPGNAPQMETQVLHFNKARDAGATSNNTLVTFPSACISPGVDEGQSGNASDSNQASVVVNLQCAGCTTITGEAFANFKLKNGWKIKTVPPSPNNAFVPWKFKLRPQSGTNDPRMIVEMTGNSGEARIRIDIEGPAGTSPYIGPVL